MTMQIPEKKSSWVKSTETLALELTCQPARVHKQWLKLIIVSEGLFHWDVTVWKHSLSVATYWFFWTLPCEFSALCMCCIYSFDLLQSSFMLSSHPVLPVLRDLSVFIVINIEKPMKMYIKDRATGLHILKLPVLKIIPILNCKRLRPYPKVLEYMACPELVLTTVLCVQRIVF